MSKRPYQTKAAWFCKYCREKIEQPSDNPYCPNDGTKMLGCSHYEWNLERAMFNYLTQERGEGTFRIENQYPVPDFSRPFTWWFDLRIWVNGKNSLGGYGVFIEIDGRDHSEQKEYSGLGGGYTRDYDKEWNLNKFENGMELIRVSNVDCKLYMIYETAANICEEIIKKAD